MAAYSDGFCELLYSRCEDKQPDGISDSLNRAKSWAHQFPIQIVFEWKFLFYTYLWHNGYKQQEWGGCGDKCAKFSISHHETNRRFGYSENKLINELIFPKNPRISDSPKLIRSIDYGHKKTNKPSYILFFSIYMLNIRVHRKHPNYYKQHKCLYYMGIELTISRCNSVM